MNIGKNSYILMRARPDVDGILHATQYKKISHTRHVYVMYVSHPRALRTSWESLHPGNKVTPVRLR